ncbi:hypothetical protein MBGDF03_01050 [Thermoplasmatales archaeon SCGC AB-540-F20]|nr:hypothetical protein MBGDF03_01050 [Thermoplasmatales archaeon SCGC AB-540-F20]
MDIEKNIKSFMQGFNEKDNGRSPNERYASFDYCFNYFQSFKEKNNIEEISNNDNVENSCLQLSFYLASWGMFRGSSYLLSKSIKYFEPLVKNISRFNNTIWEIDVDRYNNDKNLDLLIECKKMIYGSFNNWTGASDTLISKIMLGVFGNIPAFDNYFAKGFNMYSLCKRNLRKIYDFYIIEENNRVIDKYCNTIYTIEFKSSRPTSYTYTRAKIIDMIGFVEGYNKDKR